MKKTKISACIAVAVALTSSSAFAITNGLGSSNSELPFQVQVTADYGEQGSVHCGGVVLTDSIVLTSAQCVDENNEGQSPNDVSVSYSANNELHTVSINAGDYKAHSDWTGSINGANDIAILYDPDNSFKPVVKLKIADGTEQAAMLSQFANSYVSGQDNEPNVLATGFKNPEDVSLSAVSKVMMTGAPEGTCSNLKVSSSERLDTICTVSYERDTNHSICQTDRGGALLWQNPDHAADPDYGLRVVGISSYIYGPDDSVCMNSTDGFVGFTPIIMHAQWINLTVEDYIGEAFDYRDLDSSVELKSNPMYDPSNPIEPPVDGGEDGGSDNAGIDDAVNKSSGGSMGGFILLALSAIGFIRKRK
ncbi:trypsin-like serine protease [Vibrio harveyi]|uniref:trypsin-like serine protease n=1 Tax=Vibrio harveyi TaxID=669 RepID=UPI003CF38A37